MRVLDWLTGELTSGHSDWFGFAVRSLDVPNTIDFVNMSRVE